MKDTSEQLDAYGHLMWSVSMKTSRDGGDWLACLDARRVPDGIEYHVVVNSDSGGFIHTAEHATVPVEKAQSLFGLPEYWAGIGSNNGPMYSCRKVSSSWRRHIRQLMREKP